MNISCEKTNHGLLVKFQNKKFKLVYPRDIWKSYPMKEFWMDNLIHLMTINMPLVAGFKKISYNTSAPLFLSQFFEMIVRDIPASLQDSNVDSLKKIREFMNIKYEFEDYNIKLPSYVENVEDRAIVPLSCGKDSLLTLAVCKEIGLDPVSIYINDTISPSENKFKIKKSIALAKEFGIKHHIVKNELQKLNDFDHWDKNCIDLGYSHMITGFCFIALPFCHSHKARYIIFGNQRNMNYPFVSKDSFNSYPSFDQTKEWTKQQDAMIRLMTHGKVNVGSVIEPLTNLGIVKVLYSRYKEFTKHTMSCDCLDCSSEGRWCHDCNKCARLYMMIRAFDFDPKEVGFHKNLLDKKYKKFYTLFSGKEADHYEHSKQAKDEQLLAFYLAYKNGAKGYLMDLFKRKFLSEAKNREDELYKEFLGIHKAINLPSGIRDEVLSVYKEELSK